MKFSKKIVSIISILAIGAVVLAGCSGNTQPDGEGSTSQKEARAKILHRLPKALTKPTEMHAL
ncbi:MAG: hypothetical protein ACFWUM_07670 [Eubacteriales bacterium]